MKSGAIRAYPFRAAVGVGDEDTSLVERLRARFDRPELQVAIALGRPRANRKPVLQLIDGDGTTVGFAKLGVDAHTDALVEREGRFLTEHGGSNPPLLLPQPSSPRPGRATSSSWSATSARASTAPARST